MTTHNTCKACGTSPAPHRTFTEFSNTIITSFFTCSKECACRIVQDELTKGIKCIEQSLPKHALAECNCNAVQKDEYVESADERMGTELRAQVEIFFPGNDYSVASWRGLSRWELQKNYELSMKLEDFKHHLGDDSLAEIELRKTIDLNSDELDDICRVQIFSHEELLLISSELQQAFFLSIVHSLPPLVNEYTAERVRIVFWRDQ